MKKSYQEKILEGILDKIIEKHSEELSKLPNLEDWPLNNSTIKYKIIKEYHYQKIYNELRISPNKLFERVFSASFDQKRILKRILDKIIKQHSDDLPFEIDRVLWAHPKEFQFLLEEDINVKCDSDTFILWKFFHQHNIFEQQWPYETHTDSILENALTFFTQVLKNKNIDCLPILERFLDENKELFIKLSPSKTQISSFRFEDFNKENVDILFNTFLSIEKVFFPTYELSNEFKSNFKRVIQVHISREDSLLHLIQNWNIKVLYLDRVLDTSSMTPEFRNHIQELYLSNIESIEYFDTSKWEGLRGLCIKKCHSLCKVIIYEDSMITKLWIKNCQQLENIEIVHDRIIENIKFLNLPRLSDVNNR